MTMMSICAGHELIPAVLHATFSSTGIHYAHENVLLIGKCMKFLRNGELIWRFSREEHQRHCCSLALSCPVKCQLCNSFCSAGNHFHALEADAVHLCG